MNEVAEGKREMLLELLMEKHRNAFPSLNKFAYFNYGAQGLLPESALDALNGFYSQLQAVAPFTMDHTMLFLKAMSTARTALAEVMAVPAETISLLESSSYGCNVALWGLPWQVGDHLLVGDSEYPGVLASVEALKARFQLSVSSFKTRCSDREMLTSLAENLRPNTRLTVVSHITWNTGRVLPLAEMVAVVHAAGSRLLVDGAQSAGVLPWPVGESGVDFYAFPGHKWLCGPEGTGGFYCSPHADVQPTFIGPRGLNFEKAGEGLVMWSDGRRFELSTQPTALYVGLCASLKVHAKAGSPQDRFRRIGKLAQRMYQGLKTLEERGCLTWLQELPPEAGLIFFRVKNNRRLVLALEAKRILIRTIPTEDCVRISIHYLTLNKEIDTLLEAIEQETSVCA